MLRRLSICMACSLIAGVAVGQVNQSSNSAAESKPWVAPGTPGSVIDGEVFHAQILLSAAGFSTGVIDGQDGASFKSALRGFQESRGLPDTGRLDQKTRAALLQLGRPSTVRVKFGDADLSNDYLYPFPEKAEVQAKSDGLKYRNMIEEAAERFHTTPETLIALNGPTALIGRGETLRVPNVIPAARDYAGVPDKHLASFQRLNVDSNQPQGDHIIVDKSEKLLKVFDKEDKLVAQFPVSIGSTRDPLPIGNWKVTTYAYDPPFNYQPELLWYVSDDVEAQRLPPGPNGPVGVAWLDLTKEHYGIHGTPEPETIQRAQSAGCIRMTNWDVLRLTRMLKPGFKAVFQA